SSAAKLSAGSALNQNRNTATQGRRFLMRVLLENEYFRAPARAHGGDHSEKRWRSPRSKRVVASNANLTNRCKNHRRGERGIEGEERRIWCAGGGQQWRGRETFGAGLTCRAREIPFRSGRAGKVRVDVRLRGALSHEQGQRQQDINCRRETVLQGGESVEGHAN